MPYISALWRLSIGSLDVLRMTGLYRALAVTAVCGIPLLLLTFRTREALRRRSPLVFYAAATFVMAAFCVGPILRVGDAVVLDPAPYR